MRIRKQGMKLSVLSVAVQGALAVMFAMPMTAQAAEPTADDVAAIRRPTNFVEIGAENVTRDSAKFGEYNGLNKSGTELIGNFSVRGGDAYEGGNGVTRWGIYGRDLGTTSREFGATLDKQGQWSLSIGQDELRHNITDTYQTPQQGSMGGNTFTLPATFGAFNAVTLPAVQGLNAAQLGAFHTEDVGTTRKNTSFGAGFNFSPQLSLKFDYNRLAQSGAKLIAGAAIGAPATTGTWRAEAVSILMNPTNYKTDTFNLALNWVGDRGHLSGSYYGSTFRDSYDRLSWQNPMLSAASTAAAGVYQTQTLSTAPDNQLHQINLSGGYAFSSSTKLTGGLSYGRNTQNASFLTGLPEIGFAPASSLNGKVITKHFDLKLTHQPTRNLGLSAAYKFDERDNQTQSNVYRYYAINNVTTAESAANAPYSHKKANLELAGDYRIDRSQSVRLAYNREEADRNCNSYALSANCLIATSNTEDKIDAKYRLKASDSVSLSAGYGYAKRKGSYEFNAITPLAGLDTAAILPTDVNSQNYPGFVAMPYADRKRDLFKAGVNWQATNALDVAVEARYADDKYNPTLGVQGAKTTGINLDATYNYSEDASVSAYVSWQNSQKDMRIGAAPGTTVGAVGNNVGATYAALVAPSNVWTNKLDEDGNAFGISTKHKLMGGKLELTGDLSYSLDKSRYGTQVPYTSGATLCSLPTVLTCGDLPDISNKLVSLKIVGIYSLDKSSKVSVGYQYQQLKSDDYAYNAFQYGYSSLRLMPTNQQAGTYSQNLIAASYIYSFK